MADNKQFKITVSNEDGKIRVGQDCKITVEKKREEKEQKVTLLIKYPNGKISKPESVTIPKKDSQKDVSVCSKEVIFKANTEVTDNFSGGEAIIGISNGKKQPGIATELARFPLYPSSGSARLTQVYWSSQEDIKDISKKESESGEFCKNEDAFLHVKTLGLYKGQVQLKLTCTVNGKEETICENRNIPLGENSRAVAVYGTEILDFIKRKYEKECTSKITATVSYVPNDSKNLLLLLHPDFTQAVFVNMICDKDAGSPKRSEYTVGRVLVEAAEEHSDDEDTAARDLIVGCIGKLEGTGKASGSLSLYNMQLYNLYLFDFIRLEKIKEEAVKDFKNNIDDRKKIYDMLKKVVVIENDNLDYKTLEGLLKQAQDHRRPFWEREVCRDAWYAIDYRLDSNRYGSDQECPPGPVYLIPFAGGRFAVYASQKYTDTWDTFIYRSVNRKHESAKITTRSGIAFHKWSATDSQGCITLNTSNRNYEQDLFNRLFTGKQGLYTSGSVKGDKVTSNTEKTGKDNDRATRLRMLIIEERGVAGETPVNCAKDLPEKEWIDRKNPQNDYRYYHHVKPPMQMLLRKVEVNITYTEKVKDKEGREVTETKTRTSATPEITATTNSDGGEANELKARAGDTISASVVKTSYIDDDFKALTNDEKKQIQWELQKKGSKKSEDTNIGTDYSYTIKSDTKANTSFMLSVKTHKQSNCFIFNITIEDAPKEQTDTTKTQKK
ncbi:MAG: hypothetical protein LBJ63_02115 [Prevotellaceae bacterium]|jgi:hypothetical protein|nr:hypothetical protein [Prevotellaceae bacterium]